MEEKKNVEAENENVTPGTGTTVQGTETPQGQQEVFETHDDLPHVEGEDIKEGDANSKDSMDRTRSVIAFRFIVGFFGVVFLVFVTGWSGIFKDSDFKDLLLTISGTLSSALGFIIGYYFKSSEDNKRG